MIDRKPESASQDEPQPAAFPPSASDDAATEVAPHQPSATAAAPEPEVTEGQLHSENAGEASPRAAGPNERASAVPTPRTEPHLLGAVVALLMTLSAVMVLWNLQDSSLHNANTGSRFATVESLVDFGTYSINRSQYVHTIDKMKVGDDFISSKPPALPTYAAGSYWVLQKVTGLKISENEGPVVWFVSLCTGWAAHVLFLIYLYRLARLLMQRQLAIIGTVAAGGFAYLGVAYATTINNHSISAALGIMGLYYAVGIRRGTLSRLRHWVFAGLSFGFMTAVDLTSGAFMVAGFAYLVTHDWRKTLFWYLPALLPGVLVHQLLTYAITGSWIPTYLNSDLKDFPENYFRHRRSGIDALDEPKHTYAFNVLLGHHGLFSMTPLYCFSIWELGRAFKTRRGLAEAWFATGVVGAFLLFYIFRSRNYGGWCVGMRHLVPIMAVLVVYFGLWLERVRFRRSLWALVLAAFGVSGFHVQDGLTAPFQFSVWHNWLEDKPNRGRVGKKWNVSKPKKKSQPKKKSKRKKKAQPKKKSQPQKRPASQREHSER